MSIRAYIRLRGCPKCGGDILVDKALEDSDVCIQCGFRNYPKNTPDVPAGKHRNRKVLKLAGKTVNSATV